MHRPFPPTRRACSQQCPAGRVLLASALAVVALCAGPRFARADGAAGASGAHVVENLYGAKLLDDEHAVIVGAFGAVFRTADGGRTWQAAKAPTREYLFAVDFDGPTNGVAVGKAGAIITTADGGETWTSRAAGTDRNLFSVAFSGPGHAWAVGDWGTVLESTDGGTTWANRSLKDDVVLTSQSWPDAAHGYLAGEFGTVQKTEDGGATWTKLPTGTDKTIFGVAFPTPQKGWAVGIDGLVLRTVDGGATWTLQRGRMGIESLEALGFMEALRNPSLYDVRFAGPRGYVVGDIGTVLVSEDAGETWKEKKLPTGRDMNWLRGLAVTPGGRALVVGSNGLAAFGRDGDFAAGKEARP
ncbi:MAG: WD40/YVTN/BNR-like repeat-containing protein [Alphaproteobacteria bacterium]